MTIAEAAAALRARSISSVELTRACLKRAEELQPALNAFITITGEQALAEAHLRDEELAHGRDRGPLHGIPVALKDLFFTKGVRTTGGSKVFEHFIPDEDAEVVERLRNAGAVSIGKTNLHELAYGITSTNHWFGAVRNPWDRERIPGGSSGGSGVAVAAGMALMAMGTDTGGSIRIPASYCGVCGIKPTFDLVSRRGCMPLGWSLDHMGPMCATVRDTALSLAALTDGFEAGASATSLNGVRVGVPSNFFFDQCDAEVAAAVRRMAGRAKDAGAEVLEVRVDGVADLVEVARTTLLAEAADALREHWEEREKFSPEALALFDQGRAVTGADYVGAQKRRAELSAEFRRVFDRVDVLFAAGTPSPAPLIGQKTLTLGGVEGDVRLMTTRTLRPINATGLPTLSLPCGQHSSGLPMGLQIIGRAGEEKLLVGVGEAIELPFQAPQV
jgi:aspartyl-tRNA(Asn)/glutamyl-tRNA(Gln) amidotransferase subunit A